MKILQWLRRGRSAQQQAYESLHACWETQRVSIHRLLAHNRDLLAHNRELSAKVEELRQWCVPMQALHEEMDLLLPGVIPGDHAFPPPTVEDLKVVGDIMLDALVIGVGYLLVNKEGRFERIDPMTHHIVLSKTGLSE